MIGDDEELLKLLADARFSVMFLGLESIRSACLEEVNKGQMVFYNPFEVIPRISIYGIVPFIGMIVGFDHYDGHQNLFKRLYEPEKFEFRLKKWLQNGNYSGSPTMEPHLTGE